MTVSVNTKNTFKIQLVLLSFLFLFIFSIHSNASTGNPVNDGTYTIVSALSDNKVLDIDHNNTSSGANLQLYEKNGTSAQLFYLKSICNNYYIFCFYICILDLSILNKKIYYLYNNKYIQ